MCCSCSVSSLRVQLPPLQAVSRLEDAGNLPTITHPCGFHWPKCVGVAHLLLYPLGFCCSYSHLVKSLYVLLVRFVKRAEKGLYIRSFNWNSIYIFKGFQITYQKDLLSASHQKCLRAFLPHVIPFQCWVDTIYPNIYNNN